MVTLKMTTQSHPDAPPFFLSLLEGEMQVRGANSDGIGTRRTLGGAGAPRLVIEIWMLDLAWSLYLSMEVDGSS